MRSDQFTTDPLGRKCCMGSQIPGGAGLRPALSLEIFSTTRLTTSRGHHHPTGRHPGQSIPPWRNRGTAEESGSPLPSCQLLN
ncbi:rCG50528 [Rattus norvegicus]|uniref:RCG50528 n=1 Tax=Rattus norvegicus TaxID=10116 RepID=A6KCN5_RAT|nr:rCG50528 [Rattus norvegicus]